MGNNSSKPVNSNSTKLKRGTSIKKKKKNSTVAVSTTGSASTDDEAKSNYNTSSNSKENKTDLNTPLEPTTSAATSNKTLLKKKLKSPLTASGKLKESDSEDEADQEGATADDEDVEDNYTNNTEENGTQKSNLSSPLSKYHKRSGSQGSTFLSSRKRSYNGGAQLSNTSSRTSSSGHQHQMSDLARPNLKHSSRSVDSLYSSQQQPKISSRKSSMSEVPASMIMSLEPRGSILKRTSSNISSSASQSRHDTDNALTDDDDDDDDDDGLSYQGYNRNEVYEDIYKSGNISRGILKNSSSNSNIRNSNDQKIKHKKKSSSIPGGLTRSSTRGSTSNSEHNFSQTRKESNSESERLNTSYEKVNELMNEMQIEKGSSGQEITMNDFQPPLIHRHSSFGTNTESGQDHYPKDLKYPDGHYSNNEDAVNDEYENHYLDQDKTNKKAKQDQAHSGNPEEYDANTMNEDQFQHNLQTENNFIQGNGKYKKALDLDSTIQKLLDAGYSGKRTKNVILKNSEIQQICTIAREIFLQQPSLLELSPPVKIVGDVHGQFHDLIRMFEKCGFPPTSNYLFLGDYVDRGKQSLETILLLLCYKIKYPENFFLLRGNHECASVTRVYGFYDECKRRCNVRTWKNFIDTFNTMPLASIVAGKIFCVHGGLSPVLNSMDEIRLVSRPTDVPDFGLINDLLWSDPTDSVNEWEDNERGVSYCYNKVAINKFLNRFGFDLVCRAHMVVEDGYEFFNDHTLVTVFSAPNYCGEFDNWGAVMSVNHELLCSFELLEPLDSIALKQVMKRGKLERKLATDENFEDIPQETLQSSHLEQ